MTIKMHTNACGTINLKTGKNKYFNVFTDWTGESTYTLLKSDKTGKFVLIGGCGLPIAVNQKGHFGNRIYDTYTCVETGVITRESFAALAANLESNSIRFKTWD